MVEGWRSAHSPELVDAAASRALGTKAPLRYMDALLRRWKEAGISDPETALRDAPAPAAAPREAVSYTQREYKEGDLGGLFVDFENE